MRLQRLGLGLGLTLTIVGLVTLRAEDHHQHGGPNGPDVKVVSAVDVKEQVDGKASRCTTFEVTFAPGAAGAAHRHPGPIYGYVIEGEFEFAIDGAKPTLLKAGETFYEPAMALHSISRNPSRSTKARVLAIMVHPRDAKDLVIPEPEK
jgi:quercetin dioxygenase-like cupin family protein